MPPDLTQEPHHKIPLNLNELSSYGEHRVIYETVATIHNHQIKFTIIDYAEEQKGSVVIELINSNETPIGNINFEKLDLTNTCLENGIQITSVYIDATYRGLTVAITAYELLADYYLVVSDTIQTHDGAAFWKFKMGSSSKFTIHIVLWKRGELPTKILDNNDEPIIYDTTKEDLEPLIWGLESPEAKLPQINAHPTLKKNTTVLVALNKIKDQALCRKPS